MGVWWAERDLYGSWAKAFKTGLFETCGFKNCKVELQSEIESMGRSVKYVNLTFNLIALFFWGQICRTYCCIGSAIKGTTADLL